jgi:uncharacterized pyridoxamine 5'-phosphate oxidase family protein
MELEKYGSTLKISDLFLAIADGKQPRVRPVTLIYLDKRFWVTRGTKDAKVKQIR